MTNQEIGRILWLIFALSGVVISVCTMRTAYYDFLATKWLPVLDGRRIVAAMLVRDELISLTVQTLFVALAISVWIYPEQLPIRSITFSVLCLLLGFGSLCRLKDRRRLE